MSAQEEVSVGTYVRAGRLSSMMHREINCGRFILGLPIDFRYLDLESSTTYVIKLGRQLFNREVCSGCALGLAAYVLGQETTTSSRSHCACMVATKGLASSEEEAIMIEEGFENICEHHSNNPFWRLGAEFRQLSIGNKVTEKLRKTP